MTSFVSSILHHSANKLDDMSFLGKSSKRKPTPQSHQHQHQHQQRTSNLSRFALPESDSDVSALVYHAQSRTAATTMAASQPQAQAQAQSQSQSHLQSPPPYNHSPHSSPVPSPSTSWTSEMSFLAEKIRNDTAALMGSSNSNNTNNSKQAANLDRRSISQGMKLVSIAADEYDDGNESVALDIYLTGLDKILMALPNKTDPKTKLALREKLFSVEERVGILNLGAQHSQKQQQKQRLSIQASTEQPHIVTHNEPRAFIESSNLLSRITNTMGVISNIKNHASQYGSQDLPVVSSSSQSVEQQQQRQQRNNRSKTYQQTTTRSSPPIMTSSSDPIHRFKRFGQLMISTSVSCAVAVKRSPLPDILYFLFGYFLQLLLWLDTQYNIIQKIQNFMIECVKLLLEADEEYRLHEYISEALYMLFAASLKAAVAFKEAPSYQVPQQNNRNSSKRHSHYSELPQKQPEAQIEYYSTEIAQPLPPPQSSSWVRSLW
ncbi:hypothetical protein F4703DRAFT_1878723 [Phycomyces blakesleeanus]